MPHEWSNNKHKQVHCLTSKLKKLHLLDLQLTSHVNSCTSTTEHAHPSYAHIASQLSLTHLSQVGAKTQCPNSTPMFVA